MKSTWNSVSIEIVGKIIPQTPKNEEYVAVKKIQKLLNEGYTPNETAKIWNGSLAGSEKPLNKKGINKFGQIYDTMEYSLKVMRAYAHE